MQLTSSRPRSGRSSAVLAVVAVLLALAAVSGPAAAADEPAAGAGDPGHDAGDAAGPETARDAALETARAAFHDARGRVAGGVEVRSERRFAATGAFADAERDTVRVTVDAESEASETPEELPAADLTGYTVEAGPAELAFGATVVEPQDPRTDPAWQLGRRSVSWSLVGPDETSVATATFTAFGGELFTFLFGVAGDQLTDVYVCEGVADATDEGYIAARFPVGCAPDPAQVATFAVTAFDVEATEDGTLTLVGDAAPDQPLMAAQPGPLVVHGPVAVDRSAAVRPGDRLAGNDRFETAIAISRAAFPETATVAYLARADAFPDALPAGALDDGPTLLVPSCGPLPPSVESELARLQPLQVVALGGQAAVCDEALAAAAAAAPGSVPLRIAGLERIETAVRISQAASMAAPPGETAPIAVIGGPVYLATAAEFPDALAAGTIAGRSTSPTLGAGSILLVPPCGPLPQLVADELARLAPFQVVAVGGTEAVCDAVLDEAVAIAQAALQEAIEDRGGTSTVQVEVGRTRLGGGDRFSTAVAIAQFRNPRGAAEVYLARADEFPDALAGGKLPLGPILLVPSCGEVPAVVMAEIARLNPSRVTALGGQRAICDEVLDAAAASGSLPEPT